MVIEEWSLPSLMTMPEPWKARLIAAIAVQGGSAMCEGAFAAGRDRGVKAISSENSQPSGNSRTWGSVSSSPFSSLLLPLGGQGAAVAQMQTFVLREAKLIFACTAPESLACSWLLSI